MKRPIKIFTAALALFILNICLAAGYYTEALPDSFLVERGSSLDLDTAVAVSVSEPEAVQSLSAPQTGAHTAKLRLLGILPLKSVEIKQIERPMLVPGGEPFGIKLLMEGVMVISTDSVMTSNGSVSPAESCGLEKGDVILTADSIPISENSQIQRIVSGSQGHDISIVYKRGSERFKTSLTPALSEKDGYKAGLWVRDSTAGIGTLTFIEPLTCRFGGLGHPVCDSDTGEMIPVSSGEAADVRITKTVKGKPGSPGELHGCFSQGMSSGIIYRNNECGVFGERFEPCCEQTVPMAMKQEVREGPCIIRTTIDDSGTHDYAAEIEDIDLNDSSGKNLSLKVTDKRLIERTGGIIQGMSGSPIIQDGRLAGAVTHVLVNDPEEGYGIFAENMYTEGILN